MKEVGVGRPPEIAPHLRGHSSRTALGPELSADAGDLCHFRPVPPVKKWKLAGDVPARGELAVERSLAGLSAGRIRESLVSLVKCMLPPSFPQAGENLLLPEDSKVGTPRYAPSLKRRPTKRIDRAWKPVRGNSQFPPPPLPRLRKYRRTSLRDSKKGRNRTFSLP